MDYPTPKGSLWEKDAFPKIPGNPLDWHGGLWTVDHGLWIKSLFFAPNFFYETLSKGVSSNAKGILPGSPLEDAFGMGRSPWDLPQRDACGMGQTKEKKQEAIYHSMQSRTPLCLHESEVKLPDGRS